MTKIDIFSGFLGAGKTTLIKKLIAEAYSGEKLVLIENEFGEIGVDGGFLQESGVEITEMNSGCICCSLVGDFTKALSEVLDKFSPDRVLIEPSGVGKLSDVIRAVKNALGEGAELGAAVTVADASKCKIYAKNFGEFYNDQLENATAIILSRTSNISEEKLRRAVDIIRDKNPLANLITTPWEQLSGKQILDAIVHQGGLEAELEEMMHEHHHHDEECSCGCHDHEHHEHHHHDEECSCGCHDHEHHEHHHHDEECSCGCHDHHHHADDVFVSFGRETTAKYSKESIGEALEALLDTHRFGQVLRAKGMVADVNGEWIYFDYVPGESNVRVGAPQVIGKICVIGSGLDENELCKLFGVE